MPSPTISTLLAASEPHRRRHDTGRASSSADRLELCRAVAGEKGAMDRKRRIIGSARHQRDHCRPNAA